MSAIASNATERTPALTAADLMELAEFTELKDTGRWKGVLDGGGAGKLSFVAKDLPSATRVMESLCEAVAAQLEAQRLDAKQAEKLIKKILTHTK